MMYIAQQVRREWYQVVSFFFLRVNGVGMSH
jgi:hypothetical protein